MTATWEAVASRFTREECDTFAAAHDLIMPGVDTSLIADTRLRGYLDQVWFNQGEFDPALTPGTEFVFDGNAGSFNYFRGGLRLNGDHAKPWQVWSWASVQYANDPVAFLSLSFDTVRVAQLMEDPSPETVAGGDENRFYAACDKPIVGDPGDRIYYPTAKISPGNPGSGEVQNGPPFPSANSCLIQIRIPGYEYLWKVGTGIQFQNQFKPSAMQIISAFESPGGDIIAVDAGANGIDGPITISGCNEKYYERTFENPSAAGDTSIILTGYTAGDGSAGNVDSGIVSRCDHMHVAKIVAVNDLGSGRLEVTFDPPMPSGTPYRTQYAMVMGTNEGDRSIEEIRQNIKDQPVGATVMKFNSVMSICDDANLKLRYHDGVSGGKRISFENHLTYCTEMLRLFFIELKELMNADGTELNFCHIDWEGACQWYYMNWRGSQDQLIDDHNAATFDDPEFTKWGIPVTKCQTVGNQTSSTPLSPVTEKQFEYYSITSYDAWLTIEYIEETAKILKEIFGDKIIVNAFRSGTLQGWQTRPTGEHTVQRNILSVAPQPDMRPDSTAAWRHYISPDDTNVDLTLDPPARVQHPLINGTDEERAYGSAECAWQYFQLGTRMYGRPIFPTSYGYGDTAYHPGVGDNRWWFDEITHMFMNSDVNVLMYYNKRSTDDAMTEKLLLELEQVFPAGERIPQALADINGQQWGHSYIQSCSDNGGRFVHYFSLHPTAGTTITEVDDNVIIQGQGQWANETQVIHHGKIFEPTDRVTEGVWVIQDAAGTVPLSWLEYIRSAVAEKIEEARSEGLFVTDDFVVKETYFPATQIEEISEKPICWVVGLADDADIQTRGITQTVSQPIEIAFQAVLSSPRNTEEADLYVKLREQIRAIVSGAEPARVQYLNSVARRDPSGGVVNFTGLREAHTFESYFTSRFRYVAELGEDPPTPQV